MKKVFISLLSVSMLLLGGCSSKTGNATSKDDGRDLLTIIKTEGVITIATEGDWAPYTYHDEKTNELVGFDVELGKMIADKLGVSVEYKETDWDSLFYRKENGKYQLDLWRANEINLLDAGVRAEHMAVTNVCTCCNHELLFSHRYTKGKRGNLSAFLALKEETKVE